MYDDVFRLLVAAQVAYELVVEQGFAVPVERPVGYAGRCLPRACSDAAGHFDRRQRFQRLEHRLWDAVVVAERLARHGIMCAGGHFYAWRLMEALGINPGHGVLRLSFTHYTSAEDIQRLIKALDAELKL